MRGLNEVCLHATAWAVCFAAPALAVEAVLFASSSPNVRPCAVALPWSSRPLRAMLPSHCLPCSRPACPPCSLASNQDAVGNYARASGSLQVVREQLEEVLKARKEDKARFEDGLGA